MFAFSSDLPKTLLEDPKLALTLPEDIVSGAIDSAASGFKKTGRGCCIGGLATTLLVGFGTYFGLHALKVSRTKAIVSAVVIGAFPLMCTCCGAGLLGCLSSLGEEGSVITKAIHEKEKQEREALTATIIEGKIPDVVETSLRSVETRLENHLGTSSKIDPLLDSSEDQYQKCFTDAEYMKNHLNSWVKEANSAQPDDPRREVINAILTRMTLHAISFNEALSTWSVDDDTRTTLAYEKGCFLGLETLLRTGKVSFARDPLSFDDALKMDMESTEARLMPPTPISFFV